jgi:hypothetical protein
MQLSATLSQVPPAQPSSRGKSILRCDSAVLESVCKDYFRLKEFCDTSLRSGRISAEASSTTEKLRQLEGKCSRFNGISVVDNAAMETLSYVFLEPFTSLRELHLFMCPPSTILDLYQFRDRLEVLEVVNSGVTDISDVLAPIKEEHLNGFKPMAITTAEVVAVPSEYYWSKLRQLRLSNCGLVGIDESFHLMPQLEILDLSDNAISQIVHLQDCFCLRILNLSKNRISSVRHCSRFVRESCLCLLNKVL